MNLDPDVRLVVVTGRPGSGKTSVCSLLTPALNSVHSFSLISRDACKVELLDTLGLSHDEAPDNINGTATNLFWQQVVSQLLDGQSVVVDAAFQKPLWVQLLVNVPVPQVRMIVCDVSPDEALKRYEARAEQEPDWTLHHGSLVPTELIRSYNAPEGQWQTYTLNTQQGFPDVNDLVRFCLD